MDNLRKTIKLYFNGLDPDKILKRDDLKEDYIKSKSTFKSNAFTLSDFNNRSNDELFNLHQKISEDWGYSPFGSSKVFSPFHLLSHFTKQVLTEVEDEPFVNYHHLLKWRNLTLDLGEDIFTTSFLAQKDLMSGKKRNFLSWRPILSSDNKRLYTLLQKGVAENHSHLWASGPTFDISWLTLMNEYSSHTQNMNKLEKSQSLSGKNSFQFNNDRLEFKVLIKKAVALRLLLFKSIDFYNEGQVKDSDLSSFLFFNKNDGFKFDVEKLFNTSNSIDSFNFLLDFEKVEREIFNIGSISSLKIPYKMVATKFDYAIDKHIDPDNFKGSFFLYGERYILYYAFRAIYSGQEVKLLEKLLLAYLTIKNVFRRELIQLNKRYGFGNFKDFQERKDYFIKPYSIYMYFFVEMSVNFNRRLMNIVSNEYRIGPDNLKDTLDDIVTIRKQADSSHNIVHELLGYADPLGYLLQDENQNNSKYNELFFVIHFFKKADKLITIHNRDANKVILQRSIFRDGELRETVKKQAKEIIDLRNKYPGFAQLVRGIDAASSEIAARPEAFAQAFRFLKHHQLSSEDAALKRYAHDDYFSNSKSQCLKPSIFNNQLRITFHAGEDFFDIVDGMRYIDESIRFLGMTHGDRFGHALAIGVDVNAFYELKEYKIILSKHTLLDNIAWLLSKVRKFGLSSHLDEVYRLENIFKHLYSEIYLNANSDEDISIVHYQQYYDAWKLRGDDPDIYLQYFVDENKGSSKKSKLTISEYFNRLKNITYWERCRLNDTNIKLDGLRRRREISRLYFEYHYNPLVKNKGAEMKQFEVTKAYSRLVSAVQECMMQYVVQRNLYIETNPTSNILIGTIEKYKDHPIKRWYNLGLETDHNKIQECPQISVSINTDDAGIFSTTLENEYALMAIALEKEKDENGQPLYKPAMIYDWLDRIREMGLQQSFIRK